MSDNYQVLARKYRPQTFQEVIGQEETVKILKNSIRFNRLAQAYLFSGSRGIGKTTLARLLAKAINCLELSAEQEPCNKCSSCLEITAGCSLDVLEIDGASNRGIDDIRQINETIGYAPSSGKYKIYIIDEVHMLTKEAFNALLKTLEEPPPSIKFFFATTEPHKVPPTILSRCQRFDLMRINYEKIVAKLKAILNDLGRKSEEKALHLIARFSDGSLRDSQSLLDQLLCYESDFISESVVSKILGLIPQDYFFKLDEAIKNGQEAFAYEMSETIYTLGKDFTHFTQELIEHFRRYLVLKYQKGTLELSSEVKQKYEENITLYSKEELSYIIELLLSTVSMVQKSLSKKTTVEMLLLQIIRSKKRISLPLLVQRLIELEQQIKSTNPNLTPEPVESPKQPAPTKQTEKIEPTKPTEQKQSAVPAPTESVKEKESILEKASLPKPEPISSSESISKPKSPVTSANLKTDVAPKIDAVPNSEQKITKNEIAKEIPKDNKPLQTKDQTVSQDKPIENKNNENQISKNKPSDKLDTLLHFTAVELDGVVKKE